MLAGAAAATAAAASRRHAIAAICVLTAMTVAVSAVFVALHTLPTSWRSHAAHDDASGDDKSDGKSDSTSSSLLLLLLATVLVMSVVTYMVVAYVTTHTALSRLHAQLLQQSAVLCEQRLLLEALLHRQQQQQQQSEQPRQSLVPLPAAQAITPAAEHSNNRQGGDDSNMASAAAPTPAFCPRDDKDRAAMQTTHASRYKILRHIGHGSFASVYLVEDKATGQRYALKYLVCLDDHRRVAALRECETIHSVQGHPNVIRIVDMFMGYDFAAQQQQQQQQQQTQRSGATTTTRTTSSALQQTRPQWTHVKLRQDTEQTRERPQQEQVPQTQQLAPSHEVLLPLQILSDADTECLMREARRQRERRRHEQQQRTATSDGRNATHEVAVSDKPHAVAAATTTATMLSRQQTQQQQQQQARRLPHALSSSSSSSRLVRPLSSSVATATHTACSDASVVHDSAHNATAAAAAAAADTQREHTQQQQQLAKTREPCALLPPGSTPRVSYAPGGGVRYTDFVVNAANATVTTTTSTTTRTRDCTDTRVVQLRDDDHDDRNRGVGGVAATSTPVHSMTAAAAAATTTTRTAHYRNFAPATDVVPPRSLNDGAAYTRTVSVVDLTTTLPELHRCDGDAHGAADTHTDTRTSAQAAAAQRGTSAASSSNNTTHASHTTHDSNSTTAAAAAAAGAVTVRPSGYLCLVVEYHAMGDLSQYVQRLLATRVRVGGDGSGSCSVTAAAAVLDSGSDTDADDDDATRHNPLTETQLLSIAYQLSSVLCHLHAQRPPIVHRDLKPENILIKGEPRQLRLRPLPPTPRLSTATLRAHTRATTTTTTMTATRPPASPVSSSGGNTNMMCATDALAAAAAAAVVSPSCSGSSSAATTHLDTTSVDAAVTHGRITRRFIPVVVTDFGLAMTQEAHRRPGRGGGTRPYISPESWSGKTTTASDMWSLGCVLYALATGRLTERTVRVMATEAMQTTFAQTILNDLLQEQYSLLFGTFVLSLLVLDPSKRLTAAAATRCFCVRHRSGSGGSNNDDDDEDDDTEVRFDTSCPFFSNMLDL